MASSTGSVQGLVHSLEQGSLAPLLRRFVIGVVILAVALVYLGWKFRGFAIPEAMDQAQVARQIADGHGWSTKYIRPLAVWQLESNKIPLPRDNFPDTYNAPLGPLVNALPVKLAGKTEFKQGEYVSAGERFIVVTSMLCFLLAVGIQYLLLRRLFDTRLAFWGSLLTLVSDLCWQYTLSGLPQMLMLLLFNASLYTLVRSIEAHLAIERALGRLSPGGADDPETPASTPVFLGWLGATGVLLGLLSLTHGATLWIFLGALVFSAAYFRRRGAAVLVLLLAFALVCLPWVVHMYRVSGSATGIANYALFDGLGSSTSTRMRSTEGPLIENLEIRFFRVKIQDGSLAQIGHLTENLGGNLIALAFFVCLLHSFRRQEVNALRLAVLVMWVGAVVGMSLLGFNNETNRVMHVNQFGVLFLPIMLGFGLAFILVVFSRREASMSSTGRLILFTVLFLISAAPMINTLLPRTTLPFQYPPYFQPAINRIGLWMKEQEIVGSDMPWAVAWYADTKSLLIPNKFKDFMGLSDNAKLPGTLGGLFLTPISRNAPLFSGVLRGEYTEYQQLIFGRADVPYFPFHEGVLLMGDPTSYIFFSDSRRWDKIAPAAVPLEAKPAEDKPAEAKPGEQPEKKKE